MVDPEVVRSAVTQRRATAEQAAARHLGDDESAWKSVPWGEGVGQVVLESNGQSVAMVDSRGDFGALGWYSAEHMAANDPSAVVALCDGALKLLEWHGGTHVCEDQLVHHLDTPKWSEDQADREPCDVVKVLASMFCAPQEGTP